MAGLDPGLGPANPTGTSLAKATVVRCDNALGDGRVEPGAKPAMTESIKARSVDAVILPQAHSATDGLGDDWHIQHLGARAMAGAGIVFIEATHVSAVGCITHHCLGLWNAQHQALLRRLVAIIERGGAVPGVQLAHAGRKASVQRPWEDGAPIAPQDGGWVSLAPSAIPMLAGATDPHALTSGEIAEIAGQFGRRGCGSSSCTPRMATCCMPFCRRSPTTRADAYGGDATGRSRFLMETIDAVRSEWPADLPLWIRLSCTDWMPGELTIDDTVALCRRLAARGDVDLIDCSSGGVSADKRISSMHPGYQMPDTVRHGAGIATGAVGLITEPTHAVRSSAMAAPTWFWWRVPCWPIRHGRCARREHWG